MPITYNSILAVHRNKLVSLSEKRGVDQLKKVYNRAQSEIDKKLRTISGHKDTFTAYKHKLVLAQVKHGQLTLSKSMSDELRLATRDTQVESLRGVASQISALEKHFTGSDLVLPIDEAARFAKVVDKRKSSLLKMNQTSIAKYGANVVDKVEDELAQSLVQQETLEEAIDRVMDVADNEWWQAERIVRTETAWAFNATAVDGIEEISKEVSDVYLRWTEHVSDEGVPLDNRVGPDSIAMHGQIVRPGEFFVMPSDPDVDESMWGKSWMFPPNRPNDRALVNVWRPHWGSMGWKYQNGRKIYL